jgi:hypothetical protein
MSKDIFMYSKDKYLFNIPLSDYMLVVSGLCIGIFLFLFDQRIPVNSGFGWDGQIYGGLAKDFYNQLVTLDDYYIQRIMPSAIVYSTLRLLHVPLTDSNIITAFGLCNVLIICLISYIWCLIANELEISVRSKWLGFVALLFNFAILKSAFYMPVATDNFAYAIGILMVYFYLTNRYVLLYLTTVLGIFTWPVAIHMGILLLIFPNRARGTDDTPRFNFCHLIAFLSALSFFVVAMFILDCRHIEGYKVKPLLSVFNLSLAITSLYVFYGMNIILKNTNIVSFKYWLSNFKISSLFPTLSLIMIHMIATHFAINSGHFRTRNALGAIACSNLILPGLNFVAHVIYYGPIIIVLAFLWSPFCKYINNYGLGLTLCIIMGFLFSLSAESRQFICFYPLLIPFLIKVIDELKWRNFDYWFIVVLSLLFSKAWLSIDLNVELLHKIEGNWIGFNEEFGSFPLQYLFMNSGPFMSYEMYAVQGAIVLCTGILIYFMIFYRTGQMYSPP